MAAVQWKSFAEEDQVRENALLMKCEDFSALYASRFCASTLRTVWRHLRRKAGIAPTSGPAPQAPATNVEIEKKESSFHWRDANKVIKKMQSLSQAASVSQDTADIRFTTEASHIYVLPISDWHFGSYGTDHEAVEKWTDFILSIPNLYIALVGDMLQMAIKMRNVLEVSDNLLTPKMQFRYFETWLEEVAPRVLFSTWDNHSVMREEAVTGQSRYADILGKKCVYHSGIGHPDIYVNQQMYRLAVSHKFRGFSMYNPLHAPYRYLRMEAPDRDIAIQGDTHVPGHGQVWEGARIRTALNCGTLQVNSGYGKRFYSLNTGAYFPCFSLSAKEHQVTTYWSAQQMLQQSPPSPAAESPSAP